MKKIHKISIKTGEKLIENFSMAEFSRGKRGRGIARGRREKGPF